MEKFSLIFDIVTVALIVITVAVSYKRGFLSTVILFLGYVFSTVLAALGGRYLSERIYDSFVREAIVNKIHGVLGESPVITEIAQSVAEVMNDFPKFIRNDVYSKFSSSSGVADFLISKNIEDGQIGRAIADEVVAPVVIGLIQIICCLLIFSICVIIIRILASAFRNVDKIPLIGSVNKFFGGVLGLAQAVIILMVLCAAAELLIKLTSNELSWFNTELINQTYIFKHIYNKLIF